MIPWTPLCFAQVIRHCDTLMHLYYFQYPSTTVLQDLIMNMVMLQCAATAFSKKDSTLRIYHLCCSGFSLMLPHMQGTVKDQPDCRDSSLEKLVP